MNDDPFSPDADPYPEAPKLARRDVAKLFVAASVASSCALSACATPRRLACPSLVEDKERCQAKFCRYYRPR